MADLQEIFISWCEGNLLMQVDKDLGTQSHAAVFPTQPVVLWMQLVLKCSSCNAVHLIPTGFLSHVQHYKLQKYFFLLRDLCPILFS